MKLFNNRVRFSFDWYNKNTFNLLLDVPLPGYSGAEKIVENRGKVRNRGVELSIGGTPFVSNDLEVNVDFNISRNRNKVLSIGDQDEILLSPTGGGALGGISPILVKPGEPLGTFRGYVFEGIWQEDEATEASKYGRQPGDAKYKDLNEDFAINSDDIMTIGAALPNFTYGFNTLALR